MGTRGQQAFDLALFVFLVVVLGIFVFGVILA